MLIVFKGKGILVPVFFVLSFFIVVAIYHLVKDSLDPAIVDRSVFFFFGLMMLIWGMLTWHGGRDFYKNKNGDKVEMDLDNRFFFIKMEIVGKLFMATGIIFSVYGVYDLINK